MLIPYTQLPDATLDSVLDDFCTRDGTDNGQFTTLEERKSELLKLLRSEQAFITYNHEYMQPCLISRAEVPADALKVYREMKQQIEQEAALEHEVAQAEAAAPPAASNEEPVESLVSPGAVATLSEAEQVELRKSGLPGQICLGRTVMTRSVKALLDQSVLGLEQLQGLLTLHASGDFGRISDSDKLQNFDAIAHKGFMLSRYCLAEQDFYVITDEGHAQTTLMLVSDY